MGILLTGAIDRAPFIVELDLACRDETSTGPHDLTIVTKFIAELR